MSYRALAFVIASALLLVPTVGQAQKSKKGADKADKSAEAAEEGASEGAAEGEEAGEGDEAAVEEPEDWERPPVEEEKPGPEVEKPKKKELPGGDKRASVGLLLGWGFKTDRRTQGLGADPYLLGAGLRGGYTLDFQLYLGAYFVYFIGSSAEGTNALRNTGTGNSHANYMLFGAEVGYDWWMGPALVRPSLGLGMALGVTDATIDGQTTSVADFAFHPGMSVLFPIDDWFLGGDFRANVITANGVSGIALYANGGLRF